MHLPASALPGASVLLHDPAANAVAAQVFGRRINGPVFPSALAFSPSGTYTPTLTNDANLDSSTAFSCQYIRIGNVVTVSGRVNIDPTAAGICLLGISLPIASNFANANECAGTGVSPNVAGQCMAIQADAANDRAQMAWTAVDTAARATYFTFTYRVI